VKSKGFHAPLHLRARAAAVLLALGLSIASRPAAADFYSDVVVRWFLGFRLFNDDSALGNQPPRGTSLSNGAVLGVRALYEVTRWLAVEGEIPASVTNSVDDLASLLYLDPRIHARLSLPAVGNGRVKPSFVAGLGVPIVLSDNQSGLESDVLGEFYGGLAIAFEPKLGALALRLDARVEALQARGDQALTPEFELLATIYRASEDRFARQIQREEAAKLPPPPPPDKDEDKIPDSEDACPDRPEDFDSFQDSDGCPDIDNDLDRVLDIADRCPTERETLNGFEDEDGCADTVPQDLLSLEGVVGIRFASGTANIDASSYPFLRKTALILAKYPSVRLEIGGHTDNRGNEEANQALSQTRADAVRDYLVSQGIDRDRLQPVGYGPFKPMASNDTATGRNQNRRVEFQIIQPKIPEPKP